MSGSYGWKRDLPDFRDKPAPRSLFFPKGEVDLVTESGFKTLGLFNQLDIGSCTSNAVSFCAWYYWAKKGSVLPEGFSRLFIYAWEREYEGTSLSVDSGAYGHDGFRLFRKHGGILESLWPYIPEGDWKAMPPYDELYPKARDYRIPFYRHPRQTKKALKTALTRGFPIAFGFSVYESFESKEVAETGHVPMPDPSEKLVGGHEVVIVGYDATLVKCRNSWGADWGDGGYFYLPWEYVLNPNLASDFRYFCDA